MSVPQVGLARISHQIADADASGFGPQRGELTKPRPTAWVLSFYIFEARERKRRGRWIPVIMARSREFVALAPLGERVASHRRCHQPGREGAPRSACCGGEGVNNRGHGGNPEGRASLSHHASLLLGAARKSRKRTNFATRQRTPNQRRGACCGALSLCKKSWTPCGRYRRHLDKTLGHGPPHPSRPG